MERGAGEPWLEQGHHTPRCQPLPHFVERLGAIQQRAPQGLAPMPGGENLPRGGRAEAIDDGGNLHPSSDA